MCKDCPFFRADPSGVRGMCKKVEIIVRRFDECAINENKSKK